MNVVCIVKNSVNTTVEQFVLEFFYLEFFYLVCFTWSVTLFSGLHNLFFHIITTVS